MKHSEIIKEVETLHIFFEEWFTGKCDKNLFKRVENALCEDFSLISPNGQILDRKSVLDSIRFNYASSRDKTIRVIVKEVKTIGDHYLAIYEEIQVTEDVETKRISTAIFNANCQWVHVHETWIGQN